MRVIPESVFLESYLEDYQGTPLDDETITITEGPFSGQQDTVVGQKTNHINQAKNIANKALSYSDWYISRKVERDVAIPDDILSYRESVRQTFEDHKTAISGVTTEDELRDLFTYHYITEGQPESRRALPEWPRM